MLVAATVMSYLVAGVRPVMVAVFFLYWMEVEGASSVVDKKRNCVLVVFFLWLIK